MIDIDIDLFPDAYPGARGTKSQLTVVTKTIRNYRLWMFYLIL